MNDDTWRSKTADRLRKLARQLHDLAPGVLYGAVASCAVLPLVGAAQQGTVPFDALYPLLGGAGLNLLSNLLQEWKDRTETEQTQALPGELTRLAQKDADWRAVQDTLLEQFAMLPTLQAAIGDDDKAWFEQTMRHALAAVGSSVQMNVTVTGAQHVAVGQYVHQVINYYRQDNETLDEAELASSIRHYLAWVQENFGRVTLRGVQRGGSQVLELPLDEVYVPLSAQVTRSAEDDMRRSPAAVQRTRRTPAGETAEPVDHTAPIPLNLLLQQGSRLVVTGGPGCGKTTVLQHIAWALATAILTDDPQLASDRVGITLAPGEGLPLPIFVPLSAYARHRQQHAHDGDPHNRTLATFIADYLIERNCAPGLQRSFFARLLQRGQGVLLLLDGLDEVPDEAERALVRQAIEGLMAGKPTLAAVVTCRVAAYKGRTALGAAFREVRVEPLADAQIAALVTRAYDRYFAYDPAQAQAKQAELLGGIMLLEEQRKLRLGDDAPRLVDSPLMVRLLLIVHLNERRLPQHRAELYLKAVDNLLYPDYALDEAVANYLRRLVGGSHEMHRDMVQHVAFAMHSQGQVQGREIDEDALRALLQAEPNYAPYIDALLQNTRQRSALLEERLGSYRFMHLAFQEFLAGRYLAEIVRGEAAIAQYLVDHAIGDSWWREPALLTAGYLSLTSRPVADRLLRLLAVWSVPAAGGHKPVDVQLAAAELAGTACLEWLGEDASLRTAVTSQLYKLLTDDALLAQATPAVKALAADALGRLGDLRPGVGVKDGLPDITWVKIPARDANGQGAFAYQNGRHKGLPDYWIAKYPVTYAQFQVFVDDPDGYRNPRWWREPVALARTNDRSEPSPQTWPIDNRPRERVTWYDAVAYCRWLTAKAQTHPELLLGDAAEALHNGWRIRLPTEWEWEKAARGWQGWAYPWGEKYEAGRANVDETERKDGPNCLGETSAVGIYPHGASPFGVLDMSGNVWEWCLNEYKIPANTQEGGNESRVLRGGSWHYDPDLAAASFRNWNLPDYIFYNNFGFRVVVSSSP